MSGLLELARQERMALLGATAAHLDLVLEALVIAASIAVPLGIAAARSRTTEQIAVGLANVLQTVPSLALLGFLLILFGGAIGKPPALAALIVYAILPILKNTILGLHSLDPAIAEAADGMGMTSWQRLRIVELPLAAPMILGGVRIATVATVGMATIAAAIGAQGLGRFIFRGVALADSHLILLGSIPAALLALACDAALGELERALTPGRVRSWTPRTILALTGGVVLLAIAIWGFAIGLGSTRAGARTVVIGSKDSGEPILLAHMLAQLVEARTDVDVELRTNLAGTLVCYNALKGGGIDAYVEYTGTALAAILKEPPLHDPKTVLERVREVCATRDGIKVLDPLGFENTFAILMRREQAQRLGIRWISDVRSHQDAIRAGFGPEFMNRPDGYPGLIRAYDLHFANTPREMDRNLLYQALARGSIDLAAGDSTDGRIAALDSVVLDDDRHFFPPYQAVPLVRIKTLERLPGLEPALNALAGALDADRMRQLNREVDERKRNPAVVAREFLHERGLAR